MRINEEIADQIISIFEEFLDVRQSYSISAMKDKIIKILDKKE